MFYEPRVKHFRHDYGISSSEMLVPVAGAFGLVMAATSLLGCAGRLAALPVVLATLVALATVRPGDAHIVVFVGGVGVLLLGTGPLWLWETRVMSPGYAKRGWGRRGCVLKFSS